MGVKLSLGLSTVDAQKLLEKYGPNELKETSKTTALSILFRQVKNNFIIYLLTAALIISFFVGKTLTAYVILGVMIMVIVTGFVQEYKADKAVKALKKMLTHTSIVIRDGKEIEIDSTQIVPNDVLILRTGEKIPADCVILSEKNLAVNESILTGESKEIRKLAPNSNSYSEENLIYMGALIVSGKCTAKVLHTGMNTKFGFSVEVSRTVVFLAMVFFGIANAFNFRSFRKLTLTRSLLVNKNMFYASLIVLVVTLMVVLLPIRELFELEIVPLEIIGLTAVSSLSIVIIFDILKKLNERRNFWEALN